MPALFNDAIDEEPLEDGTPGFVGHDAVTKPNSLGPGLLRAGSNLWADVDGLLRTRPALAFVSLLNTSPGAGPYRVQGMGYYDTPAQERLLAVREGKLYDLASAGDATTATHLTGPTPSGTADVHFAQLVDRMFWTEGVLRWSLLSGGIWSHGTVTQFSNATTMPAWHHVCAHGFRLLALDQATDKIHASSIGDAALAANWVQTDNVRIGTGEGDPTKRMLTGQGGRLILLKEQSVWAVDTAPAAVANWTAVKITGLTGCVEGKTAVEFGQDVLFLSRFGVVSLGQLAANDSISPASVLSAPMQPYIDRINWATIGTAFATAWRSLYLLAIPVDGSTAPNMVLGWHTLTRQWATPWAFLLPNVETGAGLATFNGFTVATLARFGTKQETLLADSTGRVFRLDDTRETDATAATTAQDIESWGTSKAFDFSLPDHLKQPFRARCEWDRSTSPDVQVNLVRDGLFTYPDKPLADSESIATGVQTNNLVTFPVTFPMIFNQLGRHKRAWHTRNQGRFQEASVQMVSQRGVLRWRGVALDAFPDIAEVQQ